jgi:hypothetical protein
MARSIFDNSPSNTCTDSAAIEFRHDADADAGTDICSSRP